jgi:protein-S-isoprenylcysteine O-methyltransferase Ste14
MKKYRKHFLVVLLVLFVIQSVYNFHIFYVKNDGMSMIGGIGFGFMAIIYAFDLFEFIKNKKRINS